MLTNLCPQCLLSISWFVRNVSCSWYVLSSLSVPAISLAHNSKLRIALNSPWRLPKCLLYWTKTSKIVHLHQEWCIIEESTTPVQFKQRHRLTLLANTLRFLSTQYSLAYWPDQWREEMFVAFSYKLNHNFYISSKKRMAFESSFWVANAYSSSHIPRILLSATVVLWSEVSFFSRVDMHRNSRRHLQIAYSENINRNYIETKTS